MINKSIKLAFSVLLIYIFIRLLILAFNHPAAKHNEMIFEQYSLNTKIEILHNLPDYISIDSIELASFSVANFEILLEQLFIKYENQLAAQQPFKEIRIKLFKGLYYQEVYLFGRQIWSLYHWNFKSTPADDRTIWNQYFQAKIDKHIYDNIIHIYSKDSPEYNGLKKSNINNEFQGLLLFLIGWIIPLGFIGFLLIRQLDKQGFFNS